MQRLHETDRLARKAAWSAYRAGSESSVARARRQNRSTINRQRNGSKFGVFYQAHVAVADLSRSPDCDAMPLIKSLESEALKTELRRWTTPELVKEWHRLYRLEAHLEADEEIASRLVGRDREQFRSAHLAEAACQCRLVAIDEVLEERGVDPADCAR